MSPIRYMAVRITTFVDEPDGEQMIRPLPPRGFLLRRKNHREFTDPTDLGAPLHMRDSCPGACTRRFL